ncbi:MAG TPA: translocation/assembly module TamB domain-containing protein [Gemmatimonadota bacterium]|nr:translocation/assembly module TamB domain-containing protein [Gemmatimonadota bacterium]
MRILSKVLFVVALLVALAGLGVVGGLLWLRSRWGHEFVRGQIESRFDADVHGSVRLGRVEGDVLTGLVLHDLVIEGADGVALLDVEIVRVRYSIRALLDKRIAAEELHLIRPQIRLVRGADERWNFQEIFARREPRRPGPPGWGSWVRIGAIEIEDGIVDVKFEDGGWPVLDWQANEFRDVNGTIELALYSRDRNLKRFAARDLSFHLTGPDLTVLDLDGEGILTPDSLALKSIRLSTPGTELRADGHLTLGGADSLALGVDAPRISLDEARRLFPQVRLGGRGSFEGRVSGPAGNPSLEIESARVETGRSRVAGTGRIASLGSPMLELDLVADPLAPADVREYVPAWPIDVPVSGPISLRGPPRQLQVDADLRSPAGALASRGGIDLRAGFAYDLAGTTRGLDVGRLIGRPSVDLTLTGLYRIDGRGTSERELDADVMVELGRSRIYRWDVISGLTRGRLVGREYRADTVQVRLPQTVMRGSGTFGLARAGRIEASANIESEDLGEVWPGIGEISTRARADVELLGTYRSLDVTGELAAGDLVYGGFSADSFVGDVQMTDVGGPFDMHADGTFHRMSIAGVDADTAGVVLEYADSRIQLVADLDMAAAEATASLAGEIDFSGPTTETRLTSLVYRTPDGTWQMAEGGELALSDGRVAVREFRITQDDQTLRADGVFGIETESDLEFAAENIQLEDVARLVGQPPGDWQGVANVAGTLRGTRLRPIIDVSGEVSSGTIRGFMFQRISGEVSYEDALAQVDLTIATPPPTEDHRLVMTGTVPVDLSLASVADRLPERPVDLHILGENTDLSLLAAIIPGLTDLAGPMDIRVDITGTSEAPRFAGAALLQGGTLTIPRSGVTYEDLRGTITFDNDQITIGELTGTDGARGSFEIGGRIEMQNLRLGSLEMEMSATDLQVIDLSRQDVQVHATIAVSGTTDAPVLIGRVVVDEAIYRMPERTNKEIIDLDEAVIYVDIPGVRRLDEAIERSPSLWDRSRLDLEIEVTDDAILSSNNMRVEIAGNLSLFKPPQSPMPSLSGTLQVRRGYYEEFGKRFTIEGGEVFFYGTPELNPGLHIVASNTVEGVQGIGDVLVQITVGGTLQNPTIDLASTPPYDKSEIIAIALFGTPTPSAGQQGQFSETVRDLVTGTAGSSLLRSALTSELNLDVIEISQRQLEEGDSATLFRVGKYISPDVFVTFEQQVGGQEGHQAIGLRYQMTDLFTLEATVGTRESGVDLFWEYTY